MGWIETRISSEYAKHRYRLNWAKIAEAKIITELRDRGMLKDNVNINKIDEEDGGMIKNE